MAGVCVFGSGFALFSHEGTVQDTFFVFFTNEKKEQAEF